MHINQRLLAQLFDRFLNKMISAKLQKLSSFPLVSKYIPVKMLLNNQKLSTIINGQLASCFSTRIIRECGMSEEVRPNVEYYSS